jgi:hypothetical protein
MDEPLPLPDDEPTARCPVPDWAAWPVAVGVPLLAVIALVWVLFLR